MDNDDSHYPPSDLVDDNPEEDRPHYRGKPIKPKQHRRIEVVKESASKLKAGDQPKFNGSSDNVDQWIHKIDSIWRFGDTSEWNLLSVLPQCLKVEALDWFSSLEEEERFA
ncbi:hypothetical protein BT69DRAFT_1299388 [Atractiella rhizophila]|nr:hypothetical protein BT69DRAFT_1299388 [Atractiella rhizophila]